MVLIYANYLAEKGHDVSIIANIIDTHHKISPRVKIIKISYPTKLGTILWGIFHRIKSEIVIADIIIMAVLLSLRNLRRVIYFAQDYDVSYYSNLLSKKFIEIIYFIGLKFLQIPCVAVSDSLKEELSIYKGNIHVVHNGIDLKTFYHDPEPSLLALKNNRKSILIFGRKDYRKGLDIAIKVISNLKNHIEPELLEVWVVGEEIKENLPYKVKNFSYVDENKLRKILSSADVFLYPSRHEGLPLFVLEAMACGCPVVTTKAVGIVTHMENAWSSEIEDTKGLSEGIMKILQDKHFTEQIRKNGYILVKHYNIKKQSGKFEEFLINIANRSNEQ